MHMYKYVCIYIEREKSMLYILSVSVYLWQGIKRTQEKTNVLLNYAIAFLGGPDLPTFFVWVLVFPEKRVWPPLLIYIFIFIYQFKEKLVLKQIKMTNNQERMRIIDRSYGF